MQKSNKKKLHGKLRIPNGAMNALVIMVHGLGEHSGCYDIWAEKFMRQSVGFLTFDLRGHGNSPGIRGHTSVRSIKNDLQTIIKNMHEKYPDIPLVLFGHSMGGQIVLGYALDHHVKIQGVIASSPWLQLVHPPSSLLLRLARWVSHIVPCLTVRTGIRADQLSPNSAATKSTKKDPLLHKKISVRLFSDLWKNGGMLLRNRQQINMPILLMHGTDDSLTSFQAGKSFAQNAGKSATFKSWDGMRHDLLNNDDSEYVFQYVIKWLTNNIIENGAV